jgi:hypothetical protein
MNNYEDTLDDIGTEVALSPEQTRVTNMGRRICVLINICIVLSCLAAFIGCASVIWLILAQAGVVGTGSGAFSLNAYFQAVGMPLSVQTPLAVLIAIAVFALAYVVVVVSILASARRVLKQTVDTLTPFALNQGKRLRRLGWLSVVLTAAIAIWLVVAGAVSGTGVHASMFMACVETLVIALLFFFLAYIFDYGALLQQQADETL